MSAILKVYTSDQLKTMYKNKLLADGVGLTDFNAGSKINSIIEGTSEIISSISMDHKEALYRAIPIALYQGFGFAKKGAVAAIGYLKPYRKPAMIVTYSGAGTVAALTTTATTISAVCTGAGSDNFSFAYSGYAKTSDLVTAIDALPNWSATLIKDVDSDTLYQYAAVDVLAETNYLNVLQSMDLCLATDAAITISIGYSVTIDSNVILTTASATIAAGASWAQIAAQFQTTGLVGNIAANAIDTLNGKGYINSNVSGIEQCINDSAFSGGSEAETDAERAVRFADTVSALNAGTKNGIIAAVKGITGVRSCGIRTSYPFRGTNQIIVDDGSGIISAALLASVEKVLYGDPSDLANYPGKNAEGMGYSIVAPTIVNISMSITAYRLSTVDFDLSQMASDIKSAIEQYINTLSLGADVILSEVIKVGKSSSAACYDLIITSPSINVTINEGSFAKTGTGTSGVITVTPAILSSI